MSPTTPLSRIERRTKIEKVLTYFIYYGLPVIAAITLILAMTSDQNLAFKTQKRRAEQGMALFIIVLFIKPISLLGRKFAHARIITGQQGIDILKDIIHSNKKHPQWMTIIKDLITLAIDALYSLSSYLMRFRRQLGVATFWFIVIHAGLLQVFRHRQELPLFFNIGESLIITGIIGILGLLVAAVTSNNFSIKLLKGDWKMVQMISVYIAFAFAAFHSGQVFALILFIFLKFLEAKETKTGLFFLAQQKIKSLIK